jgi:hypothetical protein
MKKLKKLKAKSVRNLEFFVNECARFELEVQVFNEGRHLRAVGRSMLDYWPGTGRFWMHKGKAAKGESALTHMLESIAPTVDDRCQQDHIQSIIKDKGE